MICRSRIRRQGFEESQARLVEGNWRLAVDEVLGKKCVFNNNIWLLTAVWGQMGHLEQALDSLYQTEDPPPAGLPTMLERQPIRTASVLIGQCDGKEANRQSHLQATGNLGKLRRRWWLSRWRWRRCWSCRALVAVESELRCSAVLPLTSILPSEHDAPRQENPNP